MPPEPARTIQSLPPELVEAACRRDPAAWEEVVELLSHILLKKLRLPEGLLGRLDEEDIFQVAILRAWERIDRFEYRGEGSFVAWVHSIIQNTLRDDIRHHACRMRDTAREERTQLKRLIPERPAPDQQAAQREESNRLAAAISALPALQRRLVQLRLRDGHSWREIVERMGRSPRTLRASLDEALHQLACAVA